MHVVSLSASDCGLLCARWAEHDNSHRRMCEALAEAGAIEARDRLKALRTIEQTYNLDLAEICHRHARRLDTCTHPIERMVLEFIAEERPAAQGTQLLILTDRVHQLRELMDGKLVGEPEA